MRTLAEIFAPGSPTLPEGLRTLDVSPERELEPGMTVRAAFTFTNHGGAPATGVRVRLNLPEGLVYLVGSGTLDGALLDDEQSNTPLLAPAGAAIGDVAPGQRRRIELCYSVAGAIENGSTVEIQAAVASFELEPVGSNVVRLIARSKPNLRNPGSGAILESRGDALPGGEALVTVRVHNAGESSAHDVVVLAPIPEKTQYVPGSVRINGRELEGELGIAFDRLYAPVVARTLASGATATLQYRVRIDAPLPDATTILLKAQIASQESLAFDLPESSLTVTAAPEFSGERNALRVEPSTGEILPGQRLRVSISLQNDGNARAERVDLTLTVDPALKVVRASAHLDGAPLRERKRENLRFEIGTLDAGESTEFAVEFVLASPQSPGKELSVGARVSWEPSAALGERYFERRLTIVSRPHFVPRRNRIARIGTGLVRPGESVEGEISIANTGSATAHDAALLFAYDPEFESLEVFENETPRALVDRRLEIGALEPFHPRMLHLRARLQSPLRDRTEASLRVTLTSQESEERSLGDLRWTVDSHPLFSPERSRLERPDGEALRPNRVTEVTLHLENVGSDSAQNVGVRLFLAPEARIESVEGATRANSAVLVGEIAAGASAEVRVGIRLLRSLAREFPLTLDAVVTADAMVPVQLERLTIATTAQPEFAAGTLRSEPNESIEAGESIDWTLRLRNSGDGTARRVEIAIEQPQTVIYVPNSTTVNGVSVRDVGTLPPFAAGRGIVFTAVEPGVEAVIRWRDVAHNQLQLGERIVRKARVSYDGERSDEILSGELQVRATPLLAGSIAGLPFGLDGIVGSVLGEQRTVEQAPYVEVQRAERPPAETLTPSAIMPAVLNGSMVSRSRVGTLVVLGPERLAQIERQLGEFRPGKIVGHLFALRALLPDAVGSAQLPSLDLLRDALRESLDRLFIKLRIAHYAMVERELETPALRASIENALADAALARGAPTLPSGQVASLTGHFDGDEMRALLERLPEAPLASALPWFALAHLLPDERVPVARYRSALCAALGSLLACDPSEFLDRLTRGTDDGLDAALAGVRESLAILQVR
ncbi:MAG: DUF11 domain-containing protein [Candidatus Eremiobacteraeota bacterium]|nr:DUF11 domain-containing protein [Candidatus Eremiobacteraeota bacterium]